VCVECPCSVIAKYIMRVFCARAGSRIANDRLQQAMMKAIQRILQNMPDCLQPAKNGSLTQRKCHRLRHIVGDPTAKH